VRCVCALRMLSRWGLTRAGAPVGRGHVAGGCAARSGGGGGRARGGRLRGPARV
jgi:hypothetical protein